MRKAMEKVMGVKKDGGQEVLITLGLVAVGVTLLILFMNSGNNILETMLTTAKGQLDSLFKGTAEAGTPTGN